jgi:hypothetical protein
MSYQGRAVISLVGENGFGLPLTQQVKGFGIIAGLSGRKSEADRQATFVGEQVDFSRQSASGTPQSLVLGAPFLRPVAAC